MKGSTSFIFSSDELKLIDYQPATRINGGLSDAPQLLVNIRDMSVQIRGKRLIKNLLSLMVPDYKEHEDIWDFIISEKGCIDDVEAPRFIDELAYFQAHTKPVFMSLVVSPTVGNRRPYNPTYGAYTATFIEASSPYHSTVNNDWLADYIPELDFAYGRKYWSGSKGSRMIEASESKLGTNNPASLTLYDFGKSIGVSTRFDCGVRPHLIIEVKKESDCFMSDLKKAVIESVASAYRLDKTFYANNRDFTAKANYNSLMTDEIEYQNGRLIQELLL
jgi:hypothetical protein|tara:strand:+ start:1091 stop:1918 length:828 start_codon:yes stop_codon:yes gene_type:complete